MKKVITILFLPFFLSGCGLTTYVDERRGYELEIMASRAIIKECVDELKDCREIKESYRKGLNQCQEDIKLWTGQ